MSTAAPAELPSHRACAHCRAMKVRCLPDDTHPNICQRCVRSGRPCTFTPLQRRKQRKRTDTRVAELEKQMHAMRTALSQKQEASSLRSVTTPDEQVATPEAASKGTEASSAILANPTTSNPTLTDASSLWSVPVQLGPMQAMNDIVDDGIISVAMARQLFQTYKDSLFPLCPVVAIDDSITADDMRRTRPTLFLAIIAAAAGKDSAALSAILEREVMHAYATRSLIHSEKSLELVQAMLISSLWYQPPHKFGQLKYYEYIHAAANMAMDLGIGSRMASNRSRESKKTMAKSVMHPTDDVRNPIITLAPRGPNPFADAGSIENRRTFLACYFISTGVSLSLGRPCMLRTSSYIRECVEILERSPDALPTDRIIAAWTTLIIIAEECSVAFSYDDLGAIASIADLRTQLTMKDFTERLSAWHRKYSEAGMLSGSLKIMYFNIRLHLNELALHVDHPPEDFRAPFRMGHLNVEPGADDIPSAVLAGAIADCIECSHTMLDVFLSMDIEEIRAGPVFNCVRVSFAAFVLVKLCLSVSSSDSRIRKVVDGSHLKAEDYMDRLMIHVRKVVGEPPRRVPTIFLALVSKLRAWCRHPEVIFNRADENPVIDFRNAANDLSAIEKQNAEGARLIEQSSTVDDSPYAETREGHPTSSNSSNMGDATQLYASETGVVNPASTLTGLMMPDWTVPGAIGYAVAGQPASTMAAPQTQPTMPGPVEMELDGAYYNMLEHIDMLAGGGLTGLEDWSMEPNEFYNTMSMPNWQPPPGTGG